MNNIKLNGVPTKKALSQKLKGRKITSIECITEEEEYLVSFESGDDILLTKTDEPDMWTQEVIESDDDLVDDEDTDLDDLDDLELDDEVQETITEKIKKVIKNTKANPKQDNDPTTPAPKKAPASKLPKDVVLDALIKGKLANMKTVNLAVPVEVFANHVQVLNSFKGLNYSYNADTGVMSIKGELAGNALAYLLMVAQ